MPQPESRRANPFLAQHGRRIVWTAWAGAMIIASILYAGKAAEERSAFVRWRHQIHDFWEGKNIWEHYMFPNPPIMPIGLSPLMALPPVLGALCWFALKAGMVTLCFRWCFQMARGVSGPRWTWWAEGLVLLLSLRPILSDLHHGNINLLILFLVVAALKAWRQGYDVMAGLTLALSIAVKVTPALFVPYFLYKRSYRAAGATFLGLALFMVIIPSAVLGPSFNGECLAEWWGHMITPFVVEGDISPQEVNQSMGGVAARLMTEVPIRDFDQRYGGVVRRSNLLSLPHEHVSLMVKGLSFGLLGLLAWLCRTPTDRRDDGRFLGEFALVVLAMLFISERTWKHHYVTLMLPYAYLGYRAFVMPLPRRMRRALAATLALSALMIATTSSDIGGLVFQDHGHEIALAHGLYFWGGVVLFVATAVCMRLERESPTAHDGATAIATTPALGQPFAGPHVAVEATQAATQRAH